MKYPSKFSVFVMLLLTMAIGASSCSSSKQGSTVTATKDSTPVHIRRDTSFGYTFYFKVISSLTTPDDEIMIDTNTQMRFGTHQEMKGGVWRTPTGFSFLEPKDEDSLITFIKRNSLFEIDQNDVQPPCPQGDILYVMIYRKDLNKIVKINTNTCVYDFNLLTGEQRKYFPQFIKFLQRIRDVYRPALPDK